MAEFKLEDRYLVLKRTDLLKASAETRASFLDKLTQLAREMKAAGAPDRFFLVLESDWPEFAPTVDAIRKRVEVSHEPEVH